MITQTEARKLIDVALKHGARKKIDGMDVIVTASDIATSRFANNGMTQNQSPRCISISVRVLKDGKQARLSSDNVSPAGIKALVDNAITAASFLAPDESLLPIVAPDKRAAQKNVNRFDARTAAFSPAARAKAIASMVAVADKHGLIAAGVFASGTIIQAIGNSEGLFRYHQESSAEVSVTMKRVDPDNGSESTGWAKHHSTKVADVDALALAERAAEKAVASANPEEVEPGRYTVILEPSAVLDLVCFLNYDFAGTSHVDKLSCFLDKVGQPVLGKNVTITDDVFHPLQAGAPFDGDGMQRQSVELVRDGVVQNLVYGRRSAKTLCVTPTGHGLPEPSSEGEQPMNFVMNGSDVSLADMIKSTQRGVLLTRVWYVREVDPTTKIVTGMTRDGTFLIENGAIKGGIKNMRFNQSLIEMLQKVVALGPAVRTAGEEGSPSVVPALKVDGFNFSSVTRF